MPRLRELKDRRDRYLAMETAILEGAQEYTIGGTPHRLPSLSVVQAELRKLEKRINRVQGRQRRVAGIDMGVPGGSA